MATLSRKAKIPVYDEEGNLQYYVIETPPAPFERKLRLGGSPQTEIEIEAEIRRHKKQLGWKEPARAKLICPICGKEAKKTHPTQKYCPSCGKVMKRKRANERMRRLRAKRKNAPVEK